MKKLFAPILIVFIISQAVMFYLAVANFSGTGAGGYVSGPVAHFMALFITSFLVVLLLRQIPIEAPYFFAVLYSVFAAVLIEFVQQALPHRTFSTEDMAYGVLGSLVFVVLAKMAEPVHRHVKKHYDRHIRHHVEKYFGKKEK